MRKISLLIILLVAWAGASFAQDTTWISPDFSKFPPENAQTKAVWEVKADNGNSGSTVTWTKSGVVTITGDGISTQSEWLISPSISLTKDSVFTMNFKAKRANSSGNSELFLLMSYDNGATWLDADAEPADSAIWRENSNGWVNNRWYERSVNLSAPNKYYDGKTVKFAFVYYSPNNASEENWQIDDIEIIINDGVGGDDKVFESFKFENGYKGTGEVFSLKTDQLASGSSTTWENHYMAKVLPDPTVTQEEWLISDRIFIPEQAYSDVYANYSWYSFNNNSTSEGVYLLVSKDNGDSWDPAIDQNHFGVTTIDDLKEVTNIDLNAYQGDSVIFAFVFETSVPDATDFFLYSFDVKRDFDETKISNDSESDDNKVSLADLEKLIYPAEEMYNADVAEGFWQMAPEGWQILSPLKFDPDTATRWMRSGHANHDYVAFINDADTLANNEVFLSPEIAYQEPAVGGAYMMSFQWRTEADRNLGADVNPEIPNVDYDFADVVLEYRTFNGTSWTAFEPMWKEDDETVLSTTTLGWTDYDTYKDDMKNTSDWYTAEFLMDEYMKYDADLQDKKIQFRFVYTGTEGEDKDGGFFALDNFYIKETRNPQLTFELRYPNALEAGYDEKNNLNYSVIPYSQIDTAVKVGVDIYNYGITAFDEAKLTLTLTDNGNDNVFGYTMLTSDELKKGETKFIEIDQYSKDYPNGMVFEAGHTYTLAISGNINTIDYSDELTFTVGDVDEVVYRKCDDYTIDATLSADEFTGGIGSVFEFKQKETIDSIEVQLAAGHAGSEFFMSVIKLKTPVDSVGEFIYASSRQTIKSVASKYYWANNLELEKGYYAFMFNQTDGYNLNVGIDTDVDEYDARVIRGNADSLYSDEAGNVLMTMWMVENDAPEITKESKYTTDKIVIQANKDLTDELVFEAIDLNGDDLTWTYTAGPDHLIDWIDTTIVDGKLKFVGKPTDLHLGLISIDVTVEDTKGASDSYEFTVEVISELAVQIPYYEEEFDGFLNGWTTKDDQLNDESSMHWGVVGEEVVISGDNSALMEEWLISPPVYLPNVDTTAKFDTNFFVEFKWKVGKFNHFVGGVPGVLGTQSGETYNYADVYLEISKDNGENWDKAIWKEDDASLVSESCDLIYGGNKFSYDDDTYYESKIKLAKEYHNQTVIFRFRYNGKKAKAVENMFSIDWFKVSMNEKADVSYFVESNYDAITHQQLKDGAITFNYEFKNFGQTLPENMTYSLECVEFGYYPEAVTLTEDMFVNGVYSGVQTFVPDSSVNSGSVTLTMIVEDRNDENNPTYAKASKSVTLSATSINKELASSKEEKTFAIGDGVGTVFTMNQPDSLVQLKFTHKMGANHPYKLVVLSLENEDSKDGKLFATIDDKGLEMPLKASGTDETIEISKDVNQKGKNLYLPVGTYAFMLVQVEEDKPVVVQSTKNLWEKKVSEFIRGNHEALYSLDDDAGSLYITLVFDANDAPEFTKKTVEPQVVYKGFKYSHTVEVTDKESDLYIGDYGQIHIMADALPEWVTFKDNGDGTAVLSGEPKDVAVGQYEVALRATDDYSEDFASFTIDVKANPAPFFKSFPPASTTQGKEFRYVAEADDVYGDGLTLSAELLPAWAKVEAVGNTLTITGTPGVEDIGAHSFKLLVVDDYDMEAEQSFVLNVYPNAAPEFRIDSVYTTNLNEEFKYRVTATDANDMDFISISVSGDLPSGVVFEQVKDIDENEISGLAEFKGKATESGEFNLELTATDGVISVTKKFYLNVLGEGSAPVFASSAIETAKEDTVYSYSVVVTDADADELYFDVEVPSWLVFTVTGNGTAVLQGTPLQAHVGTNNVTINVGDGANMSTQSFTISVAEVDDAPVFVSVPPIVGNEGTDYSYEVVAEDEEGKALVLDATLPDWARIELTGNGTAIISGTPTESGVYAFAVQASDDVNVSVQEFELSVGEATSVNEDLANDVIVYPNPTSGEFQIAGISNGEVEIYNNAGALVRTVHLEEGNNSVNLSSESAGVYVLRIVVENEVIVKRLTLVK